MNRRGLAKKENGIVLGFMGCIIVVAGGWNMQAAEGKNVPAKMSVKGIHISYVVENMDRSVMFYGKVFGKSKPDYEFKIPVKKDTFMLEASGGL